MPDGRLTVAIAGEDHAHASIATALVDLTLRRASEGADWFDVENVRAWLVRDGRTFHRLSDLSRETPRGLPGLKLSGHIDGRPIQIAAKSLRHAWAVLAEEHPDLVVILLDTDGDLRKREGVLQVLKFLQARPDPITPLVVGLPHQEAEAWLVSTWIPKDSADIARLQSARAELGFDPVEKAHRLTARPNNAPTDAKRVLRFVALGEGTTLIEAESRSPSVRELPDLIHRTLLVRADAADPETGLADFLKELARSARTVFSSHLPPAP